MQNRTYWQGEPSSRGNFGGSMGLGLPKPTPAVKWLMVVNFAVFIVQLVLDRGGAMSGLLGVTVGAFWQVWRYVTFQFLHSTSNLFHIALNMLGVYMLGSPLEGLLGTRKFLAFYLSCGIFAGLAYVAIGAIFGLPPDMPIIGASGGVYGIVLACAAFFPQFRIILFIFPVPIRLAAILIFGGMIFVVLQSLTGENHSAAMSDVAHLGGAVAAAVWVWVLPYFRDRLGPSAFSGLRQRAWQRRLRQQENLQAEIDRILRKIHDHGLQSLSGREKKTLQDATRLQQQERDRRGRM